MRWSIAALAVAAAAGALAAPTVGLPERAALRLGDEAPLTFNGVGFRSNEHVKVVAVVGKRATRETTAGAGGRFIVRFRGMGADACRGITATAVGDRGSRATYKRAPGVCPAD